MSTTGQAGNPILEALDAVRFPWRTLRVELAERYGVQRHAAYDWDVIEVDTEPPLIDGLIWPLSAQVSPQISDRLPATQFSGLVHAADDALENLRFAVRRLSQALGPGETLSCANSIECHWASGAARLRLTVWPPAMQRWLPPNPAHEREPRVKDACHLLIDTGFKPVATPQERSWLESFEQVGRIETGQLTETEARTSLAHEAELEFVREPLVETGRLFGLVGCSADRAALIFFGAQLYLVPVEDVMGFHVTRTLPAKGPGGSRLEVTCRTSCAGVQTKRLTITSSEGVEDLEALAASLSDATGKAFELGEYGYDA